MIYMNHILKMFNTFSIPRTPMILRDANIPYVHNLRKNIFEISKNSAALRPIGRKACLGVTAVDLKCGRAGKAGYCIDPFIAHEMD